MTILLRAVCFLLLAVAGSSKHFRPAIPFPFPFFGGDAIPSDNSNSKALGDPESKLAETENFVGKWELFTDNSGVSAMHLILLPKINKVLMFDSTIWLMSNIQLPGPCRMVPEPGRPPAQDCHAHSVLMDINTAELTPLKLNFDTWCSSGALAVDGTLVSTGGFNNGSDTARYLGLCNGCKWREHPRTLANGRWYSTQVTLADGRFMVFGGRRSPTYEFLPVEGQRNPQATLFPLLIETNDRVENNLYPFVYLNTDGNLFVFANNRSVLLNPYTQQVIREFPVLPGGARNYPASGSSALLPIVMRPGGIMEKTEVLVCGGAGHDAFFWADEHRPKVFNPANDDCGRMEINSPNPQWKIERMPSPRILGDAMILPTGDVLLLNGARQGSAGWDNARDPNFTPVIYMTKKRANRFKELAPSTIPRLYHSTSALLPDGKILVAGSNTNNGYDYKALFPTELRVEKFSPPYLNPLKAKFRVKITRQTRAKFGYGQNVVIHVEAPGQQLTKKQLQVTMYAPAFTTHGISMNQRLVQLAVNDIVNDVRPGVHTISVTTPPNGNIAPPGYYMLYVNFRRVPSVAVWVQIK